MKLRKLKANKAIKKNKVLFRKYSQSRYINMFYGKGGGKTGIFQNSAEVNGDCELRDLAQGNNREAQIQMQFRI